MDKHISGPWSCVPSIPEEGVECFWIENGAQRIAAVDGPQNEEREATARLIAAAPELLEALDAINESVESLHATVGLIAARSEFEEDVHFHEKWAMDELLSKVERARAALSKARGEQV